jgi:hypothetical protein
VGIFKAGKMQRREINKKMFPEAEFLSRMGLDAIPMPSQQKAPAKPKKAVPPKPFMDFSGKYDKVKLSYVVSEGGVKIKLHTPDKWLMIKKKYLDKGQRPPIGHVTAAMRAWGCSKEAIEWTIKKHMDEKNDPAWEKDFIRLFPAEKKTTSQKKALKAVVKR